MRISHNVLLTHEDKTYSGAFIASASIPWGQSKGDTDLGGYHLVWTRDMVQTATALLACGRTDTAMRALVYLACTQRPDGSFAQNFWIDGTPYWTGIQLDEVAFRSSLRGASGRPTGSVNSISFHSLSALPPFCPLCSSHAAGAMGRGRRILTLNPGGGNLSTGMCVPISRVPGKPPNWAATSKPTRTGSNRTSTSGPRRKKGSASGGEISLCANHSTGQGRAVL